MRGRIYAVQEFYPAVAAYQQRVDPSWAEENWHRELASEMEALGEILGRGQGRTILDCSCGAGGQVIPLARLGWQVTGTDVSRNSLATADRRAAQAGVTASFQQCPMQELPGRFPPQFDWVLSAMALDNILEAEQLQAALAGMAAALRPGGHCLIRLRNFDGLLRHRPHYEFREERQLAPGRVIRLEDWDYPTDETGAIETGALAVYYQVFLWEDASREGYAWQTDVFGLRRRVIRQAELAQGLEQAGFVDVRVAAPVQDWKPVQLIARKPGGG